MASEILMFMTAGVGRETNDKLNKKRENILKILHNPPEEYLLDQVYGHYWRDLSNKWNILLKKLCSSNYDNIKVKKLAGRKHHKDFEIKFFYKNSDVYTIDALEFKHNCSQVNKLPQYLSQPEKTRLIKESYAEYFYDNYIDKICTLHNELVKPIKTDYLKYIYSCDYSKHTFFEKLLEVECIIKKQKTIIVHDSIKQYLKTFGKTLNLTLLNELIQKTQQAKIFILWDLINFHVDTISKDELSIIDSIPELKNNNELIVTSKFGSKHHLLLRWKNHLGILYPAWQISLRR